MEGLAAEGNPPIVEDDENLKAKDSAVNFQKFVYDLFDKNGILNDLRAYLRGHIVEVLKNAQTGEPPMCQKHFTQRLELTYQALNMLVAEYLLRLEFSYSLSVFVSEIPLANMVFGFAKKLMINNNGDFEDLRFKDNDVWSILNYLGVKCDSDHASKILEMYNGKENLPLLACMIKCMPMYNVETEFEGKGSSSDSLSSSAGSAEGRKPVRSASKMSAPDKCKHLMFCKTCQGRMSGIKEKYRRKKQQLLKNTKTRDTDPIKVETLMKNIGVMEQSLVNEMFQQLKSVYEAEVEMVKEDEEKKIKRSLASHALQLQKRRDEMEESFRAREEELERNVREKKQFLWGLARALRDQHAAVARAAGAVRGETRRLSAKEDSLKSQLLQAEEVLRKRGEEMRSQISSELVILEGHLESMRRERESIDRERAELDSLRVCDGSRVIKVHDLNPDELRSHYDLLKDELSTLKKYIETTKLAPKCVVERSTLTDESGVPASVPTTANMLNNGREDDRAPLAAASVPSKVVNDLKKKNVNFCTTNVDELYRECDNTRSRSRSSSEPGGAELADRLREDNERLKTFARQQREHIDELTSHQARLQAELTAARFRDTPAIVPAPALRPNTSASATSVGWRKGAGEELNAFIHEQPRVLLPGDAVPFLAAPRERYTDNRRYLINQWRALRRRVSPTAGVARRAAPPRARSRDNDETPNPTIDPSPLEADDVEETSHQPNLNETFTFTAVPRERPKTAVTKEEASSRQSRDRRPKSVPAADQAKIRESPAHQAPPRAKSPNSVLREAKLRLRKLEIEAEAVENSYMEFRRRQRLRQADDGRREQLVNELDMPRTRSYRKIEESYRVDVPHLAVTPDKDAAKRDFEKYLCEYQGKLQAATSQLKNQIAKANPAPVVYSKLEAEIQQVQERSNYLETPLMEFRKLYTQKTTLPSVPVHFPRSESPVNVTVENPESGRGSTESRSKSLKSIKSRKDELDILKENISKMYNLQDQGEIEQKIEGAIAKSEPPKEALVVEVENVSETNSLKVTESDARGDLLLVVESSVDAREADVSEIVRHEEISTHMTIIVSPKRSPPTGEKHVEKSPRSARSVSPEQAARLTRNDALNAIYHADDNRQSSVEMDLNISKDLTEDSISDYDKGGDYLDDFSADVDNYNSRSDLENDHSPISLPKNSEDDNFWDT